jgi:hypothetical protein
MSRLIALVLFVATTWGGSVAAGNGGQTNCSGASGGGSYSAACSTVAAPAKWRQITSTSSSAPCTWVRLPALAYYQTAQVGQVGPIDPSVFSKPDGAIGRRYSNGSTATGWTSVCSGRATFRWVRDDIRASDVIAAARDEATKRIPVPVPDVSPRGLGTVNLGMWLAVAPATAPPARAEAGPVWAEATPTLRSTTWTFGTGDTIVCAGIGTPIVDPNVVDQGPCGYTYRRPSPAGQPYELTVTTSWDVTYRSSNGSGTLPAISRSSSLLYPVREIQTIGEAG